MANSKQSHVDACVMKAEVAIDWKPAAHQLIAHMRPQHSITTGQSGELPGRNRTSPVVPAQQRERNFKEGKSGLAYDYYPCDGADRKKQTF